MDASNLAYLANQAQEQETQLSYDELYASLSSAAVAGETKYTYLSSVEIPKEALEDFTNKGFVVKGYEEEVSTQEEQEETSTQEESGEVQEEPVQTSTTYNQYYPSAGETMTLENDIAEGVHYVYTFDWSGSDPVKPEDETEYTEKTFYLDWQDDNNRDGLREDVVITINRNKTTKIIEETSEEGISIESEIVEQVDPVELKISLGESSITYDRWQSYYTFTVDSISAYATEINESTGVISLIHNPEIVAPSINIKWLGDPLLRPSVTVIRLTHKVGDNYEELESFEVPPHDVTIVSKGVAKNIAKEQDTEETQLEEFKFIADPIENFSITETDTEISYESYAHVYTYVKWIGDIEEEAPSDEVLPEGGEENLDDGSVEEIVPDEGISTLSDEDEDDGDDPNELPPEPDDELDIKETPIEKVKSRPSTLEIQCKYIDRKDEQQKEQILSNIITGGVDTTEAWYLDMGYVSSNTYELIAPRVIGYKYPIIVNNVIIYVKES